MQKISITINNIVNIKSIFLLYLFLKNFTQQIIDKIKTTIEIITSIIGKNKLKKLCHKVRLHLHKAI